MTSNRTHCLVVPHRNSSFNFRFIDFGRLLIVVFALISHFGINVLAHEFSADPPPSKLKIATWNVEWFFDDFEGDNRSDIAMKQNPPDRESWIWKRNAVAESIAKLEPTIIGLQEVEGRTALLELITQLKDAHGLKYRLAFVEGFDGGTEQDVAFLYQNGCVEYSRREQNAAMFDSREFYSLSKHLFGRFEWEKDDSVESVCMMNVHFRATAEAADLRRKQAKVAHYLLRKQILSGENIVLMGDTNVESLAGVAMPDDDGIESLLGHDTEDKNDDMIDLLLEIPELERKTHLILEKQFDRLLVSRSMKEDDPSRADWSLAKVEVVTSAAIRGEGIDQDHWDTRYSKAIEERDVSDHFPIMATFEWK